MRAATRPVEGESARLDDQAEFYALAATAQKPGDTAAYLLVNRGAAEKAGKHDDRLAAPTIWPNNIRPDDGMGGDILFHVVGGE